MPSASSTSTKTAAEHSPALDGLRGVAALLVLLHHWGLSSGVLEVVGWGSPLGRLLNGGWIGVDLFFVLSGYLITDHLLDKREAPHYLRAYFARRLLRIVPLYVVFLVFYLWAVTPAAESLGLGRYLPAGLDRARASWPWLFTFTANLWAAVIGRRLGGALEPVWSVCVELHYYLLWPFLVRTLAPRQLVLAMLPLLAGAALLRIGLASLGVDDGAIYSSTPTRLDAVFVGTALAAAQRDPVRLAWLQKHALWLFVTSAVLVVAVRSLPSIGPTPWRGYTPVALGAGALLLYALRGQGAAARALSLSPLRTLGKYSYAVYLFNLPILTSAYLALGHRRPPTLGVSLAVLAIGLGGSLGLALVSYRLLEARCLRLARSIPWS